MQFLMLIKGPENAGTPPDSLFAAMDEHIARQFASGALLQTGGLRPTSEGAEVRSRGGKISVVDGPFTESKEVIGGYAIVEADSAAHALEMSREFMQMHVDHWPEWEGATEIRQMEVVPHP